MSGRLASWNSFAIACEWSNSVPESLKILLLVVLGSVVFGVLHDQVTARVCLEYFTVTHPPLVESQSPTVVALAWGVVATWWMGVLLGLPLAVAARLGRPPRVSARELLRPLLIVLGTMGALAIVAGVAGFLVNTPLHPEIASVIDPSRHDRWRSAWFAHNASYMGGSIGGVLLWIWVLASRFTRSRRDRMHGESGESD